jgi:uncharacterized short protein YbdD (DUF466 family)
MSLLSRLRETAHLMVGLPDYDAYRQHCADHHPDAAPMTRAEFFRDRQQARYGSGAGKCC